MFVQTNSEDSLTEEEFLNHISTPPVFSVVRVNTNITDRESLRDHLSAALVVVIIILPISVSWSVSKIILIEFIAAICTEKFPSSGNQCSSRFIRRLSAEIAKLCQNY